MVDEALRALLARLEPVAPPFSMITYGRGRERVRHTPADLAAELEEDERDGLR